nr:ribonuclease H-like domain, reverse transcriptase, RNA-dependent DNA polymerase [Tanacetum cinerariifolium]
MAGSDNESDDASVHSKATNAQQQPNIQPQIITTVSNNNAKFLYLKKDETGRDRDGRVIILPPTTVDKHVVVQRESKARTTLLQSIPDDHVALTLKIKGGLELLSFDDLYYKLKTLEVDVKGYTTFSSIQSAGPSHSAFVSTTNASKKMSYGEGPSYSSSTTYTAPSNSKTRSHRSGNKARNKIDIDKKESARFNKKKIKEIGKKEEDSKALITVDTLVDWTDHDGESDGVIASKEFGMIAGCDIKDAIKEGTAKIYNLITGADTEEVSTASDAGEFALMGVTSEMSYGTKSSTSSDSKSVSNNFVSCDDSDKSSEVNTNEFASSDSSVNSSKPKPNDSTSYASTSSVSTFENEAEIESNVGTPIQEPIIVQDLPSFSCNSFDKNENTSRTSCNKNGYFNKKTCHFRKMLHLFLGLLQAPRAWYVTLSTFLLKHGYRRGTIDKTLFLKKNIRDIILDRKSTTGGCQFFGRRLISWQCKKQTIVATSSTEAEYVAAANFYGQVLWIQNQLLDYRSSELGPPAIQATIDKTPYTITEDLGHPMLLLPATLSQDQEGEGAGVAAQAVSQHMLAPDQPQDHLSTPPRQQTSDPNALVFKHNEPLGCSFHMSPPRSIQAPGAGQTSRETELKDHKKLFKDVVGKLVKKVKAMEVKLRTTKRKMVVSDSDQEEGGKQDVDLDALLALANAAMTVDSNNPPGGASTNPAASTSVPADVPTSANVPTCSTSVPADVPTSVAPAGVSNKGLASPSVTPLFVKKTLCHNLGVSSKHS